MTLLVFKDLEKIDYVSGYVLLTQYTVDEDDYYVVRVTQYGKRLESIKVLSLPEAKIKWREKVDEYREKLDQGRPYVYFQLTEREDELWEFQSDIELPASFYDPTSRYSDFRFKTFQSRDEAINFGRTCSGRWKISTEGRYDVVDRAGQVVRARSLKHIDWDKRPPILE